VARLFVLDALGLAYRAYYAFIRRPLINSRGENTSALFGFANTALKIRQTEAPEFWALAWDGPGPTFRHERYEGYKATRKPMPDDLVPQLPAIEDLAQAIGLPVLEVPGMEADDVMATLARRGAQEGHEVVLVTSDKDMLQLVNERIKIMSPGGRGEDYVWMDRAAVIEKWGVAPEQLRDVLALMGDASDNIPGVPGVGEKTAVELIQKFGSMEALYERLAEVTRPALREKLATHRALALMSQELVTVRTDCELPYTWEDLRCGPIRRDALSAIAKRYELQRLENIAGERGVGDAEAGGLAPARSPERRGTAAEMEAPGVTLAAPTPRASSAPPESTSARMAPSPSAPPARIAPSPSAPAPARIVPSPTRPAGQGMLDLWSFAPGTGSEGELQERWISRLHEVRARAIHGLAVLPISEGAEPRHAKLVGLALAARDGTACYVPIAHEQGPNLPLASVQEWLAPALGDRAVPKVGYDLKRDAHVLEAAGLTLRGLDFDVRLGSFLCDPERDHSLEALSRDWLGMPLPALEAPVVRGRARPGISALSAEAAAFGAAAWAGALHPLADALRAQLEAREQWALYEKLEHPLIPVLIAMERAGVALDRAVLAEMSGRAALEIARIEEQIAEVAGERINLNSGAQLAHVLFEKLGLKAGRRTKTGFSTDQAVLEELAEEHPLPRLVLEYRALTKLKSTYLDALPLVADLSDARVHTTFNQAGAATGRLSSSNPNLQNIPIRSAQGREIRRAFVAPPGSLLVGADYSQIELRVMAHLSGEPNLIEAFAAGEDVHTTTARRIFGLGEGTPDPAMRARAKVVNFGVMYGMGARSLSQKMETSVAEADEYIRNYFRVYSRVRDFLDRTLEEARRTGYVQTLLGRRRYLPGLNSSHGGERALAERVAINTPIQGSAADLMKLAMIRVHRALKHSHRSARLLLQVHDELLLESPAAESQAVADIVCQEMKSCFALSVPLEVSVGIGPTWFDVH
jgi:DNA polymerase-1